MRKIGLFLLGLALMMPAFGNTAAAQKKGPNFSNLLKVTAPSTSSQGKEMTPEEKAAKQEAFNQTIQDRRAASAREVQGFDEDLNGFVRYGSLTCLDGYVKVPDGSRCIEPQPVEGGRWKNGRVICENGRVHLIYLDGTNICDPLPEVENGRYERANLVCLGEYVPVGRECVPINEVNSTEEITRRFNFCPEGFEQRMGMCYERDTGQGQLQTGYSTEEGGEAPKLRGYE